MRRITHISIHCSATPSGSAVSYDRYHREHNGWSGIGYHYVIGNGNNGDGYMSVLDGSIETGRPLNTTPAAVRGYNKGMIAICLTGSKYEDFTKNQFKTLANLLNELIDKFDIKKENIKGHRDYPNVHKECPCFDVSKLTDMIFKKRSK